MKSLDSLKRKAEAEPSKLNRMELVLDTPYIFPNVGPFLRSPFRLMYAGGKAAVEFKDEQRQLHKLSAREQLKALVSLEEFR